MRKQIKSVLRWVSYWKQSKRSVGNQISRRIKYFQFARMAHNKGVVEFRVDRIAIDYVNAWQHALVDKKNMSFLIQHGISPFRAALANINEKNVDEFISEYDFYNFRNYVNLLFANWFDHKLSTDFILSPFCSYLPRHYMYVKSCSGRQVFHRLAALPSNKNKANADGVLELLNHEPLAVKRCQGGHGAGFYKLSKQDGNYYVNDEPSSEQNVLSIISGLDDYIITSFETPHSIFRKMCGRNSFSVLRVITLYSEEKGAAEVAGIIIRLGTEKSGPTQAGHDYIYAGVDLKTGAIFDPIYEYSDFEYKHLDKHPETGEMISGICLPNINTLVALVIKVAEYLSMTPYLVFDIIPTETGFSILEINSHGQPFWVEPYYRLKNNKTFQQIFSLSY